MPHPLPVRAPSYGPWLVALGAALWGTESAFRIPLNRLFSAEIIVFYEHVILVALFLPVILARRHELRGVRLPTYGYLLFSGIAGSAVGTVLFTEALRRGNPSVVNVVLNIQPVLSTAAAYVLFRDRLARGFFLWAPLAIFAGVVLSVEEPAGMWGSVQASALSAGTGLALLCALMWGLSTVAGRGVMLGMSLPLASGMRMVVGLCSMAVILGAHREYGGAWLWPEKAAAEAGHALLWLFLLATISGGIPLLIYFQGLKLTRASTAGYFEMMQTLAGVIITWGYFGHKLAPHQVVAGIFLCAAVAMVQRAQSQVEPGEPERPS